MYDEIATKCIASCMGLAGFIIAMIVGVFAHVPMETAILRGVLAMLICWPVGYLVGYVSSDLVNKALIKRAEATKATTREAAKKAREESERLRRESGDDEVLEV
jgi:cytosine/uracil/thiamine/allantoin permease